MRIIIGENQFNKIVDILLEKYIEDPYMADNDIYYYEPSYDEISRFDVLDRSSYRPSKKTISKNTIGNKKIPSNKKYTGMAKIIYTHPTGKQEDVKNSVGPIAVVKAKFNNILKFMNTDDAKNYSIKYELL